MQPLSDLATRPPFYEPTLVDIYSIANVYGSVHELEVLDHRGIPMSFVLITGTPEHHLLTRSLYNTKRSSIYGIISPLFLPTEATPLGQADKGDVTMFQVLVDTHDFSTVKDISTPLIIQENRNTWTIEWSTTRDSSTHDMKES